MDWPAIDWYVAGPSVGILLGVLVLALLARLLIKYILRNLWTRRTTTLMTAMGIAFVVWASILSLGLLEGIGHSLRVSGDPNDLIILRQGSTNEMSSTIDGSTAQEISTIQGVMSSDGGAPLVSAELVTATTSPRRWNLGDSNVVIRGMTTVGSTLRPEFKIVEGRFFKPGLYEAITSRRMAERFENAGYGEQFPISNSVRFRIVGIFESGGGSAESEIWTDLQTLSQVRERGGTVSSIQLRAIDSDAKDAVRDRITNDEQFGLEATDEIAYFEDQIEAASVLRFVGYVIASFLTIGAMFASANTMFAAIASRSREIGTLRAIGFPRKTILAAFLLESIFICSIGGMIGCLLTWPINGLSTGTTNFATFSEITFSFRFGPRVLLQGMGLAVMMGVVGGLLPAVRAVTINIIQALREI